MAKIDLTSREWCELVFEGKNKAYGAYEMRQTSPSRHNKATIIVMIFVLIAFSLPALLKIVVPKQEKEVMTEVTELTNLEAPEEKTEEEPKDRLKYSKVVGEFILASKGSCQPFYLRTCSSAHWKD